MIYEDVQKLEPGNRVTLFEIDCTRIGGAVELYHNHPHGEIVWQGKRYLPWSIEGVNFERTGDGQQPMPELSVGNIGQGANGAPISGVVTALCLALDDLVGARVIRRRTFKKYLDAVNFSDGNPSADPNEHLPDEIWHIMQKKAESPEVVTFVLGSPLQLDGVQLPRRQIIAGKCGWLVIDGPEGGYRGAYCGYTGGGMFDRDGNPVSDPAQDKCGGRPSDCEKRYGKWQPLSFGGFPSADRMR